METMANSANTQLTGGGACEFRRGVRAALPLWLGITPYGLAFGLLGPAAGLSGQATLATSLLVFAGSAQLIALGLVGAGASPLLVVLTVLVVNLRHLLYAASLAPRLGKLPQRWKLAISFLLTDETYAVVIDRLERAGNGALRYFYLGAGLAIYVDWAASTAVGLAIGGLVPDPTVLGLDFALPATFIGLLAPQLRTRGAWVTLAVAALATLVLAGLPGRLDVFAAIIVAATAGWGVDTWLTRS